MTVNFLVKYCKTFYLLNFDKAFCKNTHSFPFWWLGHHSLVLEVCLLELSVIGLPVLWLNVFEGFCSKNFTFHTKHLKIFIEIFLYFKYFTFENVFHRQKKRSIIFFSCMLQFKSDKKNTNK